MSARAIHSGTRARDSPSPGFAKPCALPRCALALRAALLGGDGDTNSEEECQGSPVPEQEFDDTATESCSLSSEETLKWSSGDDEVFSAEDRAFMDSSAKEEQQVHDRSQLAKCLEIERARRVIATEIVDLSQMQPRMSLGCMGRPAAAPLVDFMAVPKSTAGFSVPCGDGRTYVPLPDVAMDTLAAAEQTVQRQLRETVMPSAAQQTAFEREVVCMPLASLQQLVKSAYLSWPRFAAVMTPWARGRPSMMRMHHDEVAACAGYLHSQGCQLVASRRHVTDNTSQAGTPVTGPAAAAAIAPSSVNIEDFHRSGMTSASPPSPTTQAMGTALLNNAGFDVREQLETLSHQLDDPAAQAKALAFLAGLVQETNAQKMAQG